MRRSLIGEESGTQESRKETEKFPGLLVSGVILLMKILLATRNRHKTREFADLLGPQFRVTDLTNERDLPEIAETGTTFDENAAIKALAVSQARPNEIVVADDAGLEPVQDLLDAATDLFGDEDSARANEEHLLAGIALVEQHLAFSQAPLAEARPEGNELRFFEVAEKVDLAEESDVGRLCHWIASALHGPALHHHGLDGPEALGGRRLTCPSDGPKHGIELFG